MNIIKLACICTVLALPACSPVRLQNAEIIDYHGDNPIYSLKGFTDPGDIEPGASNRYVEYALQKACPGGIEIINSTEHETSSGPSKILYWTANAECHQ